MIFISTKKDKIRISVIGGNGNGVTGSCTYINFLDYHMLFEFGMIQDKHTVLDNYNANKDLIKKIKPSKINYIFVGHCHCDHIGNIPALYKNKNCHAEIIVPSGCKKILQIVWMDSAFINQRDSEYLNMKYKKNTPPLYTEEDVSTALQYIKEFDELTVIKLNDDIGFKYIPAGHILRSQQMELYIYRGETCKKIGFTSDLGNLYIAEHKFFIEKFEPITSCDILFGECTYANPNRH